MSFKLSNLFKHPYYYVPPCPACKSPMTGRFVPSHSNEANAWIMRSAFKHGELVADVEDLAPSDDNLFCVSCGHTWTGHVAFKFITTAELEEERRKRDTKKMLKLLKQQEMESMSGDDKKTILSSIMVFKPPVI